MDKKGKAWSNDHFERIARHVDMPRRQERCGPPRPAPRNASVPVALAGRPPRRLIAVPGLRDSQAALKTFASTVECVSDR